MIVLDTNVVSELMRADPDQAVVDWVSTQPGFDVFTTAVTVAEVPYGLARLPDGRRRQRLHARWNEVVTTLQDRILAFDVAAAREYAIVVSDREALGRPIDIPDAQIAAMCRVHGATLATRNVDDFEAVGLAIVDPFGAPG